MKGLTIRRKTRRLTRRKNRRARRRVIKQRGGSAPETAYFDATKVGAANPEDGIDGSMPTLTSAFESNKIEPEESP